MTNIFTVHQLVALVLLVFLVMTFFAITFNVNLSYTGSCGQTYSSGGAFDSDDISWDNMRQMWSENTSET